MHFLVFPLSHFASLQCLRKCHMNEVHNKAKFFLSTYSKVVQAHLIPSDGLKVRVSHYERLNA